MATVCPAWLAFPLALCACEKVEAPAPAPKQGSVAAPVTPLLAVGSEAPDVTAVAHTGERVSLRDLRGKSVVVYFYPKDDTPGCTIEAQELSALSQDLAGKGAVVIGVSTDDEASHRAFAEKYALPFLLLPDGKHEIAARFGVPVVNGKARRVTFIIGPDGKIARVFPAVTPKGHGREVLAALGG
jgi:peroxiredoxin Q/BCP